MPQSLPRTEAATNKQRDIRRRKQKQKTWMYDDNAAVTTYMFRYLSNLLPLQ